MTTLSIVAVILGWTMGQLYFNLTDDVRNLEKTLHKIEIQVHVLENKLINIKNSHAK